MAETTIPQPPTPAPAKGDEKPFSEIIPEEFRDKPYLKDIGAMPQGPEAYQALFKKLDGSQQLIGKKTGIPGADAPAEEWDKFHASLRPESMDAYEIKAREGAKPDENFAKMMREAFHTAGMTKHQAAKFQEPVVAYLEEQEKARVEAAKKADAEFDTLVKATFGSEHEKVTERVNALLKEHAPENLKPHIGKLSNEHLALMSGVIESIRKQYVPEDELTGGPAGGKAVDVDDLRAEGVKLMGSDAYKDAFHRDHDRTVARVKEIYSQVGKATPEKKK